MADTFNITWTQFDYANVTGFYDAIVYANSVTNDYFGIGICISFFAMLFLIFQRYGEERAFGAASFSTFVIAGILRSMGQISDMFFLIFMIMTGISILILWRDRFR